MAACFVAVVIEVSPGSIPGLTGSPFSCEKGCEEPVEPHPWPASFLLFLVCSTDFTAERQPLLVAAAAAIGVDF